MSSLLVGYYDIGLRALNAARLGLQVAGNNIANVSTPGYARRRVDLTSGFPLAIGGGFLDRGVEITRIDRAADRFLQASLQREKGSLAGSRELLRGLREIESTFGGLEDEGIFSAYNEFTERFTELSGQPESLAVRRQAIASAADLADRIRSTYQRLKSQQRTEDQALQFRVEEVNRLGSELAQLNDGIFQAEAGGAIAGGLRDERDRVLERLSELTGGSSFAGQNGRVGFSLPGGPTLVTPDKAIAVSRTKDAAGLTRLTLGDVDFTDKLRDGELGALLGVRDDRITARIADIDALARAVIARTNALTSRATDLDGNAGGPLFTPDPPGATGAAAAIAVSADVLADARRLAVSDTGAPGDGTVARQIAELRDVPILFLGKLSPAEYLSKMYGDVGSDVVRSDVEATVAGDLVSNLSARREAVSGVSLDEEALELTRHQQAYQAAARFIEVLNEITRVTLSLGAG